LYGYFHLIRRDAGLLGYVPGVAAARVGVLTDAVGSEFSGVVLGIVIVSPSFVIPVGKGPLEDIFVDGHGAKFLSK
jgi:hypothetical protein